MENKDSAPSFVYLKDYRVSDYLINKTILYIKLHDDIAVITSHLEICRNPEAGHHQSHIPLVLDGINLDLKSLAINDVKLDQSTFYRGDKNLTISNVPDTFTLTCVTEITPSNNTALVGLFKTKRLYATQCEPQGFRHITYYLDRPDILSEFTVTLEADKLNYPVLLANGNMLDQGVAKDDSNRHWVIWHDPFKKPSYLFAMVAGRLEYIENIFTTRSGRRVPIRIFADSFNNLEKCKHALSITKQAMEWDEQMYGREYDLDIFMIVAIAEINVGGQENKGLNIYRADRLLIDPKITTDQDVQYINEVVAHEYFHNWSGNRVTCRDWFQLSLKEGFTTYRGFQFCHDRYSAATKRIEEIKFIRSLQFSQDASPLAHSIRPDNYLAIWNFYTATVYQKGAEVVRMLHTLLGDFKYRQGTDLFFDRYDGQAVTTEEFVACMELAYGKHLGQFRLWYTQSGTLSVCVKCDYCSKNKRLILTAKQSSQKPLLIPLSISLIGENGPLPLVQKKQGISGTYSVVLEFIEREQTFVFEQVNENPVPSLFIEFSAPVKWAYDYSQSDLVRLIEHESNGVCRWEAAQRLWTKIIQQAMKAQGLECMIELPPDVIELYRGLVEEAIYETGSDKALVVQLLSLPSEAYLVGLDELNYPIDLSGIYKTRVSIKKQVALALQSEFEKLYGVYVPTEPLDLEADAMASRALRNLVLDYLVYTEDPAWIDNAYYQLQASNNMSDAISALKCLVHSGTDYAQTIKGKILCDFYNRWKNEPLVVNRWFEVQATSPLPNTLEMIESLLNHPAFDIRSPNQVRALIGSFGSNNSIIFHRQDGRGYQLFIDQIITLNDVNPQMGSRILSSSQIIVRDRYDSQRQELMLNQLKRLYHLPNISPEISEIVRKCL